MMFGLRRYKENDENEKLTYMYRHKENVYKYIKKYMNLETGIKHAKEGTNIIKTLDMNSSTLIDYMLISHSCHLRDIVTQDAVKTSSFSHLGHLLFQ